MQNELKIFENEEFGEVRSLMIDNEPWFVGRDVTEALGYKNANDALNKRIDKDDKGVANCDTLGGAQEMIIINESGLYSLIFSSKLESAKKFKYWVTSEVLPSIRKTGSFMDKKYPVDASTLKGVASSGCLIERTMKHQGSAPFEVTKVLDSLFKQSGIVLPECFVKPPEAQMKLKIIGIE